MKGKKQQKILRSLIHDVLIATLLVIISNYRTILSFFNGNINMNISPLEIVFFIIGYSLVLFIANFLIRYFRNNKWGFFSLITSKFTWLNRKWFISTIHIILIVSLLYLLFFIQGLNNSQKNHSVPDMVDTKMIIESSSSKVYGKSIEFNNNGYAMIKLVLDEPVDKVNVFAYDRLNEEYIGAYNTYNKSDGFELILKENLLHDSGVLLQIHAIINSLDKDFGTITIYKKTK